MSYDNFATTFSNSRKNHPWPELDYITEDIRNNSYTSILDVGCGNGRFLEQYDGNVVHYLGTDSSKGMIEEAHKLHPGYDFEVLDMIYISSLGKENSTKYNAIVLLASFHHLETKEERLTVLAGLKGLLAPNGKIYMTNWNLRDQEKYQKNHRGNGDYDIKIGAYSRYYHGFTLTELEELALRSGYIILENRIFEGGRNIVTILGLS